MVLETAPKAGGDTAAPLSLPTSAVAKLPRMVFVPSEKGIFCIDVQEGNVVMSTDSGLLGSLSPPPCPESSKV